MADKTKLGWFHLSDPAANLCQIRRFVTDRVFKTEEGGYGLAMRLDGVDGECISREKLAAIGASLLHAQRAIPNEISLFQVWWKRRTNSVLQSRFAADSPHESVQATERERNEFLKTRKLYETACHWVLYARPPKVRVNTAEAIEKGIQRTLRTLHVTTSNLMAEMCDFGPQRLSAAETLAVFRYMANVSAADLPATETYDPNNLSGDICLTRIDWHRYGLVANKDTTSQRYIQPFSLLKRPAWTEPNMLSSLLGVEGEFVVVMESRRTSFDKIRALVTSHERFMEFFRANPLVRYFHRDKPLPKTASSVAQDANLELSGLGGVIHDIAHGGQAYCQFSIIGLAHAKTDDELIETMAGIHRAFGMSEAKLLEEGIGGLVAYQAMFPGAVERKKPYRWLVRSLNVRRRWLREDHIANLSLCFCAERGSMWSDTLEDECVAVFETRARTPYYWDPFASGPRGVIVVAEPRRGKTFLMMGIADHEAKYGGYIFIWDIGGAYENFVLKHGGTVVKVGLSGPRLGLFSLPNTEANWNQTTQMVMILLRAGGAEIGPDDEEDIREQVAAVYDLDDWRLRRLGALTLSRDLQPYLRKWTGNGIYGAIFDNAQDDIHLARILSFDFKPLSTEDRKVLMEPLLFWMQLRIDHLIQSVGNLAVPKLNIFDELQDLLKDPSVLRLILDIAKRHGKMLGGIMLGTQDGRDLGPHIGIIRNACPDVIALGGAFDRQQFKEVLGFNDRQLDLIPDLKKSSEAEPGSEFLAVRSNHAKILRFVASPKSAWLYTTHPQDVRRKLKAIEEYGHAEAFDVLAASVQPKVQSQGGSR